MIIATFRQKPTPFAGSSKSVPKAQSTAQSSLDKGKSKVIVISDSETESETEPQDDAVEAINEPIGWAYVGSHNFTPSAWGTLSGSGFSPVLNVGFRYLDILSFVNRCLVLNFLETGIARQLRAGYTFSTLRRRGREESGVFQASAEEVHTRGG
jgi:hypothetical protein